MSKHYVKHSVLDAELYPEAVTVAVSGYEIPVPAGHYLARYSGGVLVLAQEDFEALYQEAPVVRSYSD